MPLAQCYLLAAAGLRRSGAVMGAVRRYVRLRRGQAESTGSRRLLSTPCKSLPALTNVSGLLEDSPVVVLFS